MLTPIRSRTDVCTICLAEYEVEIRRRSKDEALEYSQHLCFPSHIVTWDFGEYKQARFSASNVQFPVFLVPDMGGLGNTMDEVDKLDHVAIKTLQAVYRVEVAENTSPLDVIRVIKGFVQSEWYLAAKGANPVANQKKQEERVAAAKEPKKAGNGDATPKAPRVGKTYRIAAGKSEEIKALKGQAGQVATILKAVGKADAKRVGEELVALGDAFKTRQAPERVAGYYLKQLSDKGLFEEVAAPATA